MLDRWIDLFFLQSLFHFFYLANLLFNIESKVTASELDVHRLAQFELSGTLHGSKQVGIITGFFVKFFVLNMYVDFHPS